MITADPTTTPQRAVIVNADDVAILDRTIANVRAAGLMTEHVSALVTLRDKLSGTAFR